MDKSSMSDLWELIDVDDESLGFTSKDGAIVPFGGAEQWIDQQHLVGQSGPSQYSVIPYNGGKVNGTAECQDEKKRQKDKRYRERCREERRKMESDLERLASENSHLKSVNKETKKQKDSMNQNLQTAGVEINKLKNEICKLREYIGHQQILVEAFSQKIVSSNSVHEQIKVLRDEIARLRPNVSRNEQHVLEKKELLDRILYLQYQNKVLKVQVQALCEKISNDKNNEGP